MGPNRARPYDPLLRLFAVVTVLLIVVHAVLLLRFHVNAAVPGQLWLTPMFFSFFALSAVVVAILVLGRHHVLRDPASYWTGLAFVSFATGAFFYASSFPAILIAKQSGAVNEGSVSIWIIAPARMAFCLCLLAAALELKLPAKAFLQKTRSVLVWLVGLLALLVAAYSGAARLPVLALPNGAYTPFAYAWHGLSFVLFTVGAALSIRRYRRTSDKLSVYVALIQVVLALGDASAMLGGNRFSALLTCSRALLVLLVVGVLFALLADYAVLFRRDRENVQQDQSRLAALRYSEARFRALAEAMPALLFVTNAAGQNTYTNPPFSTYSGRDATDLLGDGWLQVLHPDDRERANGTWAEAVRRCSAYEVEYRFRRFDGAYRWFLVRGSPMYAAEGRISDWFGTCMDIHDRKQTEHALQQSNEDLRQLIWAAGHDLQEPIRLVTTSAQFLERREGARLSPNGHQLTASVLSGARRMQALVAALRAYWLASEESSYETELVNVADALTEAVGPLRGEMLNAGAQVLHGPLPIMRIGRETLVQVLRQLADNAIRYRSADRPVQIQLAVQRENECWKFQVTDNGPGIAPEYRQQIFGLFKRLHRHDQIPGSGMGLAYCRRLLEQRGGQIWVESAPGGGAAFYFTLPIAEQEPLHTVAAPQLATRR
jgi:PAS domain S-box-containing protein